MSAKTAYTRVANALVQAGNGVVGNPWPTENADEVNVYIAVTVAGTTFLPVIECSPDNGVTWFVHTVGAAITGVGSTLIRLPDNVGKLMRMSTASQTGSFTMSVWAGNKRTMG